MRVFVVLPMSACGWFAVRGGRGRGLTVPRKLDAKGNKSKDPCAVISRVSRFVSLFGCYSEAHTHTH